jgi:ABC-type transport system involved in cytochrome bd biosynthesis fused ATPase/permease subunit
VSARPPRDDLAETTAVGEIYLRRLVRAQLGLSVTALVAFGGGFAGLPLTLVVLCVAVFPVLLAVGLLYQRRANALDEEFRDLVDEDR